MTIYIITFEGAYGTQILEVFTTKQKALDYLATCNPFYNYEIIERIAI